MAASKQKLYTKYVKIHERFKQLFEVDRMRIDDVMETLSQEFYLEQSTISKILSKDPAEKAGVSTNQISLFQDQIDTSNANNQD